MEPTERPAVAGTFQLEDPDSAPGAAAARPRGMSRLGWIVFGALAGAPAFALVAIFVVGGLRRLFHSPYTSTPWGVYAIVVGAPVGLVLGGLVGSRARGMWPRARIALGAIGGAVLLATAGGFAFLSVDVTSPEGPMHPMRNFVLGAIVGSVAGLVLGGFLGTRPAVADPMRAEDRLPSGIEGGARAPRDRRRFPHE